MLLCIAISVASTKITGTIALILGILVMLVLDAHIQGSLREKWKKYMYLFIACLLYTSGRPDMAYFGFTNKLLNGETIKIFNYGNCKRDFTYVDDIVEGVVRVMQGAPEKKNGEDGLPIPPYAVYNLSLIHI